jgi:hypothetical protein
MGEVIVNGQGLVGETPGELCRIKKTRLSVDHTYQREIRRPDSNESKVRVIAANWEWVACGVLLVGRRKDGTYSVVDGQHRLAAALLRDDITHLPCIVFESNGSVQEADGFLKANTYRKPLSGLDRFKALVHSGDATAISVAALLESTGHNASSNMGNKDVHCVMTMLKWQVKCPVALSMVWPVIAKVCDEDKVVNSLVDALMYIEIRLQGQSISDEKITDKLLKVGYARIMKTITAARGFREGSSIEIAARGLLAEINKGLHNKIGMSER